MIVMKFGGSSVANAEQIEKARSVVAQQRDKMPVVVSSAHKGMTDLLIESAKQAAQGVAEPQPLIDRQRAVLEELGGAPDLLDPLFAELTDLFRGISLVRELSPRSLDYVASFGERMAVRCIADYFTRHGLPARAYDAWELGLISDANFGQARPLPGYEVKVRRAIRDELPPQTIPVITGYVAKSENGDITTLGRNGSDLTATLLGSALSAEEVQIWTDTDGVMSADPSLVKDARNIPTMRFDEAAELAFFGSRMLHPSTLLPAMDHEIPVRVLNTNRPEHPGTVICGTSSNPRLATSIVYKEHQQVLTLTTTRMFGTAGFLADFFSVLAKHEVVVDVVSTTEISISITTDCTQALRNALPELRTLGECEVSRNKSILAIVGQHLARYPGLGGRILKAVGDVGVSVEMISYAMQSISLVLLLDDDDIDTVVPVLHRMLFAEPQPNLA